jgi:DNA invertase Pin-like site-specific DNA recombinase
VSIKAISYLRTSSLTNASKGSDKKAKSNERREKDSETRQRTAILAYAQASGFDVIDEFYDVGVAGTVAVQDRPQFSALLDRIEGNGVRHVIIEDASRFARDLMVQEGGLAMLALRGVTVLTASGDNLTDTTDPLRKMMRQIIGAVVEAEKARLVAKLKGARDRKSAEIGMRIEGASYARTRPEVVTALAELREAHPDWSQDRLAEGLEERGILNANGKRLAQVQVSRLLRQMEAVA